MNLYAITIDTDWAPDCAIDYVASELIRAGIKATWFLTHDSPSIRALFQHPDLFEIGIHPNFLPGSTQGTDERSILQYMLRIVPEARVVRTHSLVQSVPLMYRMATDFNLTTDVSLILPDTAHLAPHNFYHQETVITRVPYYWEDDLEAYTPHKCWNINSPRYQKDGLKIFNFHPMYAYLNCDTMDGYFELKKIKPLPELDAETCAPFVNRGEGTNTLFQELIECIRNKQSVSYTISDIVAAWKKEPAQEEVMV